jgi:hypothetical protein
MTISPILHFDAKENAVMAKNNDGGIQIRNNVNDFLFASGEWTRIQLFGISEQLPPTAKRTILFLSF